MFEEMLVITQSVPAGLAADAIHVLPYETEYAANVADEQHRAALRRICELALRIMVVDDELNFRRVLCRQLERDYGVAKVTDVGRGIDALSMEFADYDVILIDVVMPIMRGDVICKEMLDRKVTATIALMSNDPLNEAVAQAYRVLFWPKGDVSRLDQILLSAAGGRSA